MNDALPLLEVRGAGHAYGDHSASRWGCRNVDFDLWPGEVIAMVGESGSGKSSALKMVYGNYAVNRGSIARGFITELPLLLLDEPTASLDARNRDIVTGLIREKLAHGTAVLGIIHDATVRGVVADRVVDLELFGAATGAAA